MQEKLGKIFLSEDLKSIKIKIYISLVLSILTKLYFILIFSFGSLIGSLNGNIFEDLFHNFFLICSVFSCILIIFALYSLSKLSHTHLLRNYIIWAFSFWILIFITGNVVIFYARFYFGYYVVLFFVPPTLIALYFGFLYYKELFKISNKKLFWYCFGLLVIVVMAKFAILLSFLIMAELGLDETYLSILAIFELAFIVFYPIWLLLELIAWVKFKEFKRQF